MERLRNLVVSRPRVGTNYYLYLRAHYPIGFIMGRKPGLRGCQGAPTELVPARCEGGLG
jgi:hypothetical protein